MSAGRLPSRLARYTNAGMRTHGLAWLLFLTSSLCCTADPKEYSKGVVVTPVLVTGTTTNGAAIAYPKTDSPEVKVLMVEIPPGAETGWHRHPLPAVAYVLSGSLRVDLENGQHYSVQAGQAIAEVVGTLHNGHNTGTEPVRILMTVIGQKGVPITEK